MCILRTNNYSIMNVLREWCVQAPWGKIALISWGSPTGYPVLLVHGRQDSAATFTPLLNLLPPSFHYVGMDLPGHGLSDPFPPGVMLMRFQYVVAVDLVLQHLGWRELYYMAHSLGTEQGLFYNAIYPNRIKKLILLDPGPALRKIQIKDFPGYFALFHNDYYAHYAKYNADDRAFSREGALAAVRRARGLTQQQAELVLSRNLTRIGEDQYRLSWDRRLKNPAPLNLCDDFYFDLFSRHSPPTLVISATGPRTPMSEDIAAVERLLRRLQAASAHFLILRVAGDHDVHLTHPERLVRAVRDFLAQQSVSVEAKL